MEQEIHPRTFDLTLCSYPATRAEGIIYGRMFYWPIVNKDKIETGGFNVIIN